MIAVGLLVSVMAVGHGRLTLLRQLKQARLLRVCLSLSLSLTVCVCLSVCVSLSLLSCVVLTVVCCIGQIHLSVCQMAVQMSHVSDSFRVRIALHLYLSVWQYSVTSALHWLVGCCAKMAKH